MLLWSLNSKGRLDQLASRITIPYSKEIVKSLEVSILFRKLSEIAGIPRELINLFLTCNQIYNVKQSVFQHLYPWKGRMPFFFTSTGKEFSVVEHIAIF